MQSDGTFTYQYDAEGNRTSRTRISNDAADDYNTDYTWDNRNRLTQITFKNNAGDVTKTVNYDSMGRTTSIEQTSGGGNGFALQRPQSVEAPIAADGVQDALLVGTG